MSSFDLLHLKVLAPNTFYNIDPTVIQAYNQWTKCLTPRLDVCIEAMALELEMADPNSTCLDGHGIGV